MKTNKLVVLIAVLAILLSGFSSPATAKADLSKVDQRVLNQLDGRGNDRISRGHGSPGGCVGGSPAGLQSRKNNLCL